MTTDTTPREGALTLAEAAVRLRCSQDTVAKLAEDGHLPLFNVGTGKYCHWRIPVEAVERFIRRGGVIAAENQRADDALARLERVRNLKLD